MIALPFTDRRHAGKELARALWRYSGTRPLVLAIPRGGVPIGRVVADALDGDLDIVLVHKLCAPFQPELAIGAIDELGAIDVSEHAALAGADRDYVRAEASRQLAMLARRRRLYTPSREPIEIAGRTVIVVDDGLATGATMAAALRLVRGKGPARLVCAVPVASEEGLDAARSCADDVVCLAVPLEFGGVGRFYLRFDQVDDGQVIDLLEGAEDARTLVEPVHRRAR